MFQRARRYWVRSTHRAAGPSWTRRAPALTSFFPTRTAEALVSAVALDLSDGQRLVGPVLDCVKSPDPGGEDLVLDGPVGLLGPLCEPALRCSE